ncbi:lysophospholipid acyltransferase family protein [Chryseobacterium sp. A301]
MKTIANVLWRLWFIFLSFLFILILGIPVLLLSLRESHFKYAYKFIRLWCHIVFYGMGFSYKLISKTQQKLSDKEHYIFISNHTSIMDVLLMVILHPKHPVCFIGKAELAKIPLFSIIYKRICILVDRNSPRSRAAVFQKAAQKMNHGQNIVIFPEGGVSEDPNVILDTFKDGAFVLSTKHKFPIVVYTFLKLGDHFPFAWNKGYPGKIHIVRNEILNPNHSVSELKLMSHSEIKKTLLASK